MILSADEILKRLIDSGCTGDTPRSENPGAGSPACTIPPPGDRRGRDVPCDGRLLVISPFSRESLQPASYDLRAGEDTTLARGTCTLLPTREWVELPSDLAATLRCRSSYGRKGIMIGAGYVDPGFRGQLTLCLVNMGPEDVGVPADGRIVQMIIHEVKGGSTLYNGRYQDSHGAVSSR